MSNRRALPIGWIALMIAFAVVAIFAAAISQTRAFGYLARLPWGWVCGSAVVGFLAGVRFATHLAQTEMDIHDHSHNEARGGSSSPWTDDKEQ